MSFSCQKEFDQFFNRLDRPVEESRPDRCRLTRPVSISASDFGEDLFFFFSFFFGDHLLLVGKFVISARKTFGFRRRPFFFWKSPAFGRKIRDFGQKNLRISAKTFFFGDHLLLVGKFVISAGKSLQISAKTWRSLAFGWKICDFVQKKPSHFGENLCPPDFNFAPPISRSWRCPCTYLPHTLEASHSPFSMLNVKQGSCEY